jgi:hypothetical protein
MRRRAFIAALGGVAAWPLVTMAQFKHGLAENGLVEGRDIAVD